MSNQILSSADQDRILRLKYLECNRTESSIVTDGGLYCPKVWDTLSCWNQTLADTVATQPCPGYYIGFDAQREVTRTCMPDGTWFIHPDYRKPWSNYSQCAYTETATIFTNFSESSGDYDYIVKYLPIMKSMSQVGYSVSLISLLAAFTILASIKKLRCPRNTLHMHLFVSFILRAFISLLKDKLFVAGVGLPSDVLHKDGDSYFLNPIQPNWECKLVTSLWQYFIMANYSWILMEGLYLHNLIFLAMFSDTSAITLYVVLGWGLPVLFVLPWVAVRITLEDTFCWTTNRNTLYFLIIRVPTGAFILINFLLFINIVRVLLLKLRASVCKETRTYRRWAKSTLILGPLFGVHYSLLIGMSYSIGVDRHVELVWLFCDQLFASFQGFFVAVLYCFMNGEVLTELGKKWHRYRWQPRRARPLRSLQPGPFNGPVAPNSCYSSTSCLSIGVPRWPGSKTAAKGRAFSLQYTDNSQLSCCSNLADGGVTTDITPASMEMRFIRPH